MKSEKNKQKNKQIVYLAMPASMSHCFVILFYTQTRFSRGFLYRKACKCIKKTNKKKQCHTFDGNHVGLKTHTKGGKVWNSRIVINNNKYLSES